MRTIRKTRPGESHIHNHGTVAGGETIAVDGDTADYLVESGGYEYAESDAQSDADADDGDDTTDTDADAESGDVAAQIDAGECPWCDDYDGESVGRHASAAHPDEWDAYKEAAE